MLRMIRQNKKVTGIAGACMLAGSQANVAKALGIKQQAISKWVKQGWVPLKRGQQIEKLYGVDRFTLINPKIRKLLSAFPG